MEDIYMPSFLSSQKYHYLELSDFLGSLFKKRITIKLGRYIYLKPLLMWILKLVFKFTRKITSVFLCRVNEF